MRSPLRFLCDRPWALGAATILGLLVSLIIPAATALSVGHGRWLREAPELDAMGYTALFDDGESPVRIRLIHRFALSQVSVDEGTLTERPFAPELEGRPRMRAGDIPPWARRRAGFEAMFPETFDHAFEDPVTTAFGVPFRSVAGAVADGFPSPPRYANPAGGRRVVDRFIVLDASALPDALTRALRSWSDGADEWWLPTRPLWPGLLANWLIWSIACLPVTLGIGAVPARVRGWRRRRKGLCGRCAYPRPGASASPCPECGHASRG